MRVRKLSVVVPVYNEQATVYEILSRVLDVRLPDGIAKEILVVNDASTDASRTQIETFVADHPGAAVRAVNHEANQGKGAAVHTALAQAEGDYLVIQDADLELDPRDYNLLLAPVLEGRADVVYGSRFLHGRPSSTLLHRLANAFLTGLSNLVLRTRLTDMETCYKLVPATTVRALDLREKRFGFEPEITARLARLRVRFAEVPIAFTPRVRSQGKKIGWRDGFRAIYCIVKYGWFSGTPKPAALIAGLLALGLYLPTMSRTYGAIDKGEMAAAAATLGIAHPTGYPLLSLLGHLATKLSPLRPVLTLNLLAAILTAGGVALLTLLFDRLLSLTPPTPKSRKTPAPTLSPDVRTAIAASAALFTAFTPTWWEQALGFEAYALQAFLLPLVSLLFLRFLEDSTDSERRSWLSGSLFAFALGLTFANHSTTIMLAPAFLFLYAHTAGWRAPAIRRLFQLVPAFAAGLLPYLWLYLRAKQHPALNWGDPSTLDRLWPHISGKQFQYVLFFEWRVFSQQTEYLWNRLLPGLAYVGLPLALLGALYLFRRSPARFTWTTLILVTCVGMCGLHDVNELAPYHLPVYLAMGVFIACAFAWIAERSGPRAALALAGALAAANGALHFKSANESAHTLVEDLTRNVLGTLPQDAVILSSHWDYWTSGALYAQHVDLFRKDVRILDPESFRSEWYLDNLEREDPALMAPARDAVSRFRAQIRHHGHTPVFTPAEAEAYWLDYHAMLQALIDGAADRRPFFVTDGIDPRIGAGYERIPKGLAYRLTKVHDYQEQPFPRFQYRPWTNRIDPYAVKIAEIYTMALLARARYEEAQGQAEDARRYGMYALSFDPQMRPDQVPDFPLHIESQIRDVLRNYEMLRARTRGSDAVR